MGRLRAAWASSKQLQQEGRDATMKEFKVGGWGSSGYCQVFSGWSPWQVGAGKEGRLGVERGLTGVG